ncbi:MAG: hypothetical protein JHC93_07505, partial [Parachlamydiales bacterium]|nr:hypothetical protein [Parachlamydiales bacterium]
MTVIKKLLTDPFVQIPTSDSVNIVWFTEWLPKENFIEFGDNFSKKASAKTLKLSRMQEEG